MRSARPSNGLVALVLGFALVVGPTTGARAWGPEGHKIVAEIAEKELTPKARAAIDDLLQGEAADARTLPAIANWADAVRPSRPNTGGWHFVNVPVTAHGYDALRDCPDGNCVVAKIEEFEKRLGDKNLLRPVRAEALKFLVHFVGDIHQPLHCADNGDRGGNDVKVIFERHTRKLHQVWDSGIVEAADRDDRSLAARLLGEITPQVRKEWLAEQTPAQWADENFKVAKEHIYEPLGLIGHPGPQPHEIVLGPSYGPEMRPTVETQLMRAGVRLAFVLNAELR